MALVPEGDYNVEFTGQGLGETMKGAAYVFLNFQVHEWLKPNGDRQPAKNEVHRKMLMWLSDKALDYTVGNLRRLGIEVDSFGRLELTHPNPLFLVGKKVKLTCKHEKNQKGDLEERWQVPFEERKVSAEKISNLDAMLKHSSPDDAVSAGSEYPGAGVPDEDVPF